jgi:hypothetical protein
MSINFAMGKDEVAMIERYLNRDMVMLEWGAGGSTLHFPRYVDSYHSIEHHKSHWHNVVTDPRLPDNVTTHYVEVPNEPAWKHGRRGIYAEYRPYVDAIDLVGIDQYDAILVDGRARTACAFKAYRYLKPDGYLFFHDYYLNRPWYHDIETQYKVIDSVKHGQTLAVLQKR